MSFVIVNDKNVALGVFYRGANTDYAFDAQMPPVLFAEEKTAESFISNRGLAGAIIEPVGNRKTAYALKL